MKIVIITSPRREDEFNEWKKAFNNVQVQSQKCNNRDIQFLEIKIDSNVFIIVNGQNMADWIDYFSRYYQDINNCINTILKNKPADYAFIHSIDLVNELKFRKPQNPFWTKDLFPYSSAGGGEWQEIWELFKKVWGEKNLNKIIEWIENKAPEFKKKIEHRELTKKLSLLIHRIAHIFLPLDIDLMGICEVLGNNFIPPANKSKEEWAKEYYNEVFNNMSPQKKFNELLKKVKKVVNEFNIEKEKKEKILEICNENVKTLRDGLGKGFEIFKEWAQDKENVFHKWLCDIMEKLEKLIED